MRLCWIQNLTTFLLASLCCLVSSVDQRLRGDSFGLSSSEFMQRIPRSNDFALAKRDVCTNAIPGTVTQICTPGNTLCCVPSNSEIAFPQCQQILGQGFCCVESDNCYIDTVSNCSIPNSVPCTLLAPGTTQACCPPFTVCPSNFNQSVAEVRCNIIQGSQTSQISSSKSSLSSSSSSSSFSSSPLSTTMSSTTSSISTTSSSSLGGSPTVVLNVPNSSSAPSSNRLSAGAGAGIGIGAAVAVLAFVGVGFWAYRWGKRRGKGEAPERDTALNIPLPVGQDRDSAQVGYQHGFNQGLHYTKHELPGELPPRELPDGRRL